MKNLLVAFMLALPYVSFADGWVCTDEEMSVRLRVYNNTHPTDGTRKVSRMVASNPSLKENRTLARFSSEDDLLKSQPGSIYTAKVDLRRKDIIENKERILGGAKVNNIETIVLDVDFSYRRPVDEGTMVDGIITLNKRNGDVSEFDVRCERYLKTDPTDDECCD